MKRKKLSSNMQAQKGVYWLISSVLFLTPNLLFEGHVLFELAASTHLAEK